jgi:hypothetical protein
MVWRFAEALNWYRSPFGHSHPSKGQRTDIVERTTRKAAQPFPASWLQFNPALLLRLVHPGTVTLAPAADDLHPALTGQDADEPTDGVGPYADVGISPIGLNRRAVMVAAESL